MCHLAETLASILLPIPLVNIYLDDSTGKWKGDIGININIACMMFQFQDYLKEKLHVLSCLEPPHGCELCMDPK